MKAYGLIMRNTLTIKWTILSPLARLMLGERVA